MDAEAERFIVAWARDLPAGAPPRLEVQVGSAGALPEAERALAGGVRSFFGRRAETATHDLRAPLRRGRMSLAIGIVFLAVCVSAAQVADRHFARSRMGPIFEQLRVGMFARSRATCRCVRCASCLSESMLMRRG